MLAEKLKSLEDKLDRVEEEKKKKIAERKEHLRQYSQKVNMKHFEFRENLNQTMDFSHHHLQVFADIFKKEKKKVTILC